MRWVNRLLVAWVLAFASPLLAQDTPTYEFVFETEMELLAERSDGEVDLDAAMQSAISVLHKRLNGLDGTYTITHEGGGRLRVEMTAANAPKIVRDVFGVTGDLDFMLVEPDVDWDDLERGIAPPGTFVLTREDGLESLAVRKEGGLSGDRLTDARTSTDTMTGEPVIMLGFDAKGAQQFAALTSANVGKQLAIILDGKLLSAPTINEPILGGQLQISGSFTQDSANQLAIALRSGALPTPLKLVEERVISATP